MIPDLPTPTATPDRRHPLDVVSLVGGLLAVLVAARYLLADLVSVRVAGAVVGAVLAAVLALGVLAVALRRLAQARR